MRPVIRVLETVLFSSRWLLAPFYIGLVITLFVLLVKTVQHVIHMLANVTEATEATVILDVLSMVDLTLTGSLIILVVFSGYENFVSHIEDNEKRAYPTWMGQIDFAGLKLKLMSSIVAISAIQLLRAFMDMKNITDRELYWSVGIHMAFVVSGLILALADRLSGHDASVETIPGPAHGAKY